MLTQHWDLAQIQVQEEMIRDFLLCSLFSSSLTSQLSLGTAVSLFLDSVSPILIVAIKEEVTFFIQGCPVPGTRNTSFYKSQMTYFSPSHTKNPSILHIP